MKVNNSLKEFEDGAVSQVKIPDAGRVESLTKIQFEKILDKKSRHLIPLLLIFAFSIFFFLFETQLFFFIALDLSFLIELIISSGSLLIICVLYLRSRNSRATKPLFDYLAKKAKIMGFHLKKSYKSLITFISLYAILLIIVVFTQGLELFFIVSITALLTTYSNVIIPLSHGISHHSLIYLEKKYKISLKFRIYSMGREPVILFWLSSNNLAWKTNKIGQTIFQEITLERRLKTKSTPFTFHLRFIRYMSPFYFEKQLFNLILALKDWQIRYSLEKFISKEKYQKAIEFITETVLKKDPEYIEAYLIKAKCLKQLILRNIEPMKNKTLLQQTITESMEKGIDVPIIKYELFKITEKDSELQSIFEKTVNKFK